MSASRPKPKHKTLKRGTQGVSQPPKQCSVATWANDLLGELDGKVSLADLIQLRQQVTALDSAPTTQAPLPPDPTKPTIVTGTEALSELAAKLAAGADIAVDLETSSRDHRSGVIVGIGLAIDDGTYYVPVNSLLDDGSGLRPGQLPLVTVLEKLRLQDKHLIAHNSKYEFQWLRHHGNIKCQFVWDTMFAARLLRSDLPADLKTVAERELDVTPWGLSSGDMARMQFLPINQVAAYCAKDCWYTLALYRRQQACVWSDPFPDARSRNAARPDRR